MIKRHALLGFLNFPLHRFFCGRKCVCRNYYKIWITKNERKSPYQRKEEWLWNLKCLILLQVPDRSPWTTSAGRLLCKINMEMLNAAVWRGVVKNGFHSLSHSEASLEIVHMPKLSCGTGRPLVPQSFDLLSPLWQRFKVNLFLSVSSEYAFNNESKIVIGKRDDDLKIEPLPPEVMSKTCMGHEDTRKV